MSKTKHKHNREDDYGTEEVVETKRKNRHKQKRFDRALRTMDIDELLELEDGDDGTVDQFYYDAELEHYDAEEKQ